MRSYSQDLRDKLISSYNKHGYGNAVLAAQFGISEPTAREWVRRYKATGDYSSRQGVGCGRKRIFDDRDAVLDYLGSNPDANAIEIRDHVAPGLHMNTFYDSLTRMNITYKKRAQVQRKITEKP
jgi:transposase